LLMRQLLGSAFGFGVCLAAAFNASGADQAANPPSSLIHTYNSASDEFFALALKAEKSAANVVRHILIVDTSASQTGKYREQSMKTVRELLQNLPESNSVQIFAADTTTVALTDGFVSPSSLQASQAMDLLAARTPLGATDLGQTLVKATAAVTGNQPVSLVYVGDGMSAAGLIPNDKVHALVDDFQERQIAYHAVLLGPALNTQLSGVLVNHTGGTITISQESGLELASQIQSAPLYVQNLKVSGGQLSADDVVALRSDRHTLVYGKGHLAEGATVQGDFSGNQPVQWVLSSGQFMPAGPEVKAVYGQCESTNGINNQFVGLSGLTAAANELHNVVSSSAATAERLHRIGRDRDALQLAKQASILDENNVQLTSLVNTIAANSPFAQESADDQLRAPSAADQAPLLDAATKIQIMTQKLSQEVNAAIDEARRSSAEVPDYSEGILKDILATVRDAADINPEVRDELERRVISAIGAVQSDVEKNRLISRQRAEAQAISESQRKLLAEAELDEQRLQSLIDQVRGNLNQARKGDAEAYEEAETVARTALLLRPGDGTATAALVVSEAAGQLDKAYKLVNMRHDRFLETLYQVELSHVPFPDEPPVLYPPADVWRALSLTRKPKYESVDLRSEQPTEAWLNRMLKEPIPNLSYPGEVSLKEVLDQLSQHYTDTYGSVGGGVGSDFRMTIVPDRVELDLEGISSLEDVTISDVELQGILLKNALKLIFAQTDPELTYMIRDEVMVITTREAAESDENLITRVYPMGDLVMPTNLHMMMGGMGGGGMGGGMGGMGGGMG
ncbi:MAG: hypothetical protein KDA91_25195, partial [Planctomycetaceae bacterium]|nr:hypothetical protein [Planctomycetaceae bacterium]